jgi:hypothetical protein
MPSVEISRRVLSIADVASDVTAAALGQTPVATFKANGDRAYAPTDGGITSAYTTASAWQNFIDVTSYVRSLSSNSFSLLVAKDYDQANSSQFFTKEVTDLTNTTYNVTFAQADLQPQLTVEYEADPTQVTSTATSTGDTYLRMGNTLKRGAEPTMEVLTDLANSKDFVGLLRFVLPTEVTSGRIHRAAGHAATGDRALQGRDEHEPLSLWPRFLRGCYLC